jgi:hypothetical protein
VAVDYYPGKVIGDYREQHQQDIYGFAPAIEYEVNEKKPHVTKTVGQKKVYK